MDKSNLPLEFSIKNKLK